MKKFLVVGFLCLAIGLSGMYANGQSESTSDSGKKVTLQLMYWDNVQKKVIDSALAEFEAANPNITVETSVVPWAQYWQKLQTTTVAGNAPDVFWMNVPNFPKYTSNDLLLNLSPYMKNSTTDASNYPADLMKAYTSKGNVFAIPEQFDTICLVYNKDMFDAAGMKYPDASWDWNTLRDAAIKLTKSTATGTQYGFLSAYGNQSGYYNFMVANGGYIISDDQKKSGFDDPKSIQALQFMVDLIVKDHCAPTGQEMVEQNDYLDLFTSRKVAMATIGSWSVPIVHEALGDSADIAPLPKSPNTGERKSIIHGLSWAGYAKTKNPEATWKLIQFLTDKGFNESLAKTAITIPAYKGMAADWVKAIPSYNLQCFIDALDYSWPYPVSSDTSQWESFATREIKNAFLGTTTVTDAMHSIADQMNKLLAQN